MTEYEKWMNITKVTHIALKINMTKDQYDHKAYLKKALKEAKDAF